MPKYRIELWEENLVCIDIEAPDLDTAIDAVYDDQGEETARECMANDIFDTCLIDDNGELIKVSPTT